MWWIKEHQQRRFEVLDRIRAVSWLNPQQARYWQVFKELWDEKRRHAQGPEWGRIFAEETKHILEDMYNGDLQALSKWMEKERARVLPMEECLQMPAITFVA